MHDRGTVSQAKKKKKVAAFRVSYVGTWVREFLSTCWTNMGNRVLAVFFQVQHVKIKIWHTACQAIFHA